MNHAFVARLSYFGGLLATAFAILFKLLLAFGIGVGLADATGIAPYRLFMLGVLLLLLSIASNLMAQSQGK